MISFNSVLLVGGRSTRMGQDKALMDWHGRPLWVVQAEKLISVGSKSVFLAARKEQDFEARLAVQTKREGFDRLRVIEDPMGEDCGPIGAISRCLAREAIPLLVLAVDLPLLTGEYLHHRLIQVATAGKGMFYVGSHGPEVLSALYVPEMLPRINAAMRSGAFSLQALVKFFEEDRLCEVMHIGEAEAPNWSNANTREEAVRILSFKH